MKDRIYLGFVILAALIVFISSCRKDNYFEGEDISVRTSLDTLTFDTVFTEIGTTTKFIKLYNDQDGTIIIDDIRLENSTNYFRLNIDGHLANDFQGLEIPARDSVYIFVEATIDPEQPLDASPYIIEDHLHISIDGNEKSVLLEAWGQNAVYFTGHDGPSGINVLSCNLGEFPFDDPRPYVIYGTLLVDSCTLVLPPGTEVYIHGGVAFNQLGIYTGGLLYFTETANLQSRGTVNEPVTIYSDRLEEDYEFTRGQYSGIVIGPLSQGTKLEHTTISQSAVGIRVDSLASASFYNCEFSHTAGTGILGRQANIYAENCLLHNNGLSGIQMALGGNYEFNNCSIINYDNQDEAISLSNFQCVDQLCLEPPLLADLKAIFRNCLILGNDSDEILLSDWTPDTEDDFDFRFDHCFVQVDELLDEDAWPTFFNRCENCLNNPEKDTLFIDMENFDFHLDTLSAPIDAGKNLPFFLEDKDGVVRDDGQYDVGCYEFKL